MHRLRSRLTSLAAAVLATVVLLLVGAMPAQADEVRSLEYWLNDYGISQAWSTTQGAGIKVAIIDTGVDGAVPDLAGAVVGGTDESGLGSPDGETPVGSGTDSGHATWVASLLAGRGTGAGNGLIGVAPQASILSVSVALGVAGSNLSSDDQVAKGIRWAVDNGATVINLSLTRNTLDWPTSWDSAFEYAFDHNVVIVAAAGNRGSGTTQVDAPATIPGVLGVAGVTESGTVSSGASAQGITLGVAAPSENLLGADPSGNYVEWEGTSGAAPIVSGIVALVQASHPGMSAANVIERVLATARPVGAVPNPTYGYGLVDASSAVAAAVPTVTANPLGSLSQWVIMHRRAAAPADGVKPGAGLEKPTRLPAKLAPQSPYSVANLLYPQWVVLTRLQIPLAIIFGFGVLVTLGMFAATRHFRRASPQG